MFATSVLQGLRRTLEEVAGTEAGPTVEEECLVQKLAIEPEQVSYDGVTRLPLDPKLVADAIKEELMFMRKLQVYHGSSCELSGQVWTESHRNTMS